MLINRPIERSADIPEWSAWLHWKVDFYAKCALGGTILDESGNSHHGLNIGNNITATEGWRGVPNTAGRFNGTNSYCVVPHETNLLTPHENTMVALVRVNSFNSQYCQYNQILAKWAQNGGMGN